MLTRTETGVIESSKHLRVARPRDLFRTAKPTPNHDVYTPGFPPGGPRPCREGRSPKPGAGGHGDASHTKHESARSAQADRPSAKTNLGRNPGRSATGQRELVDRAVCRGRLSRPGNGRTQFCAGRRTGARARATRTVAQTATPCGAGAPRVRGTNSRTLAPLNLRLSGVPARQRAGAISQSTQPAGSSSPNKSPLVCDASPYQPGAHTLCHGERTL